MSRGGRIFRSRVCFDAPSHIPYVFVARVVNKIHKCKHFKKSICVLYSPNLQNKPLNFFFKTGEGRARATDLQLQIYKLCPS